MKNIIARILGVSRTLLDFILPILRAALAGSLERLLPIALGIVAELATSEYSGADKKAIAVDRLKKAAINEGITTSVWLLNWTVETAVGNLRSSEL